MIKTRRIVHPARPIGVYTSGGSSTMYLPSYQEGGEVSTGGHYRWQDPPPGRNVGGDFFLRSYSTNYGSTGVSASNGAASYVGSMYASVPGLSLPSVMPTGATKGAEAYSRMKPAQPSFESLNALFELRELPGMLKLRAEDLLRRGPRRPRDPTPSDYSGVYSDAILSYEFGIKPLIKDIQNMVSTQRNGQKIINQLLRDNGKPVRRRITVSSSSSSTQVSYTGYNLFHPVLPAGLYAGQPKAVETTTVSDRIWASAQFQYFLPPGPRDVEWNKKMLARIYGQDIRLQTIYNAVPWTWLADWFTDLGHLVSNLDDGVADRLGATYYYVMRETDTTIVREATAVMKTNSGNQTICATSSSSRTTKTRLPGDPFGWGTPTSSLSPRQWAILGALGMSRIG